MATADSVKAKMQGLIDSANAKTGGNDTALTGAVNTLIAGFGQGGGSSGGTSGIYMAKVTPESDLDNLVIAHNLGTTDILSVAIWAETLGDYIPETAITLHKVWNKTDITTRRGGNGFSIGYSWNVSSAYADSASPNTANYETLTVIDENTIRMPRTVSGTSSMYKAGVTYTVIVVAANEEV